MLYMVLALLATLLIGGYFAFRYISLIYALGKIKKDVDEIKQNLTQNQMIHLPTPDRHLGKLLCSFNSALEGIRKERWLYEKREKEFQIQIENISHDLRTPLTVILGYLKLFKNSQAARLSYDLELSDTVNIIEQKAEALKNLVTQFYDYSRLNADDYGLTLCNVDVSRMLRESLMGNYQILEQAHLNLTLDIPDRPVWVSGDPSALERIFFNLFQNAGRYADSMFQVSFREHPKEASLLFSNDTRLLSKEDIPHLFDRFYMQDSSRSRGGTGLGLTVAKSLAEKMDGTLSVDVQEHSDSNAEGSMIVCFELRLKSVVPGP